MMYGYITNTQQRIFSTKHVPNIFNTDLFYSNMLFQFVSPAFQPLLLNLTGCLLFSPKSNTQFPLGGGERKKRERKKESAFSLTIRK
jgi:hypothetical protein